ncbi:MAG: RidA family protein [Alphaproteobacteria bacterium]
MRQHRVWPKESWHFSVPVPASLGVRAGDTIHVGGQVALDTKGVVRAPGDLIAQTVFVMEDVERVLGACGATLDDMVKMVVFYVDNGDDGGDDGTAMLQAIDRRFKGENRPVMTLLPMAALAFPGMMVEIEGYAMGTPDAGPMARTVASPDGMWRWRAGPFPHGVRCGEMIFTGAQKALDFAGRVLHPGDSVAQSHVVMKNLKAVLAVFGADCDDAVKVNNYYVGTGGSKSEWQKPILARASYYSEPGPAATGIPLARLYPEGLHIQMEIMAMLGTDGSRLPKQHVWPEGHWDWPVHLPFKHGVKCRNRIFVGGQVSMDSTATIIDPGDLVKQTKTSMANIKKVLAMFGASLDDIAKVNCFYAGGASEETLMQSARTRFAHFTPPGPCSTGVPLPALAYEGMMTEIEVVAVV